MIAVEIQRIGHQLRVRMPNDSRFHRFATLVGAQRDGDTWVFPAEQEKQVRALVRSILAPNFAAPSVTPVPAPASFPLAAPSAAAATIGAVDAGALLESSMDLRTQLRRAAELVTDLDPDCVDASFLEELSAGFESIAARLRAAAMAREARASA